MNIRIVASGAACVLFSNPALADDLTISSKTTSPVSTAAAANSTPGNITITSSGSVEVSKTGPAVLLNSSNTVSNSGTISNAGGSGAVGVTIVPGYTGALTNSGTINVVTSGTAPTTTGQVGVQLVNGNNISFGGTASNGSTSLTASSVIGVITPGDVLTGTGFNTGTYIVSQSSGPPGGPGVYVLSQPTTAAITSTQTTGSGPSLVGTGSGTNLTVSSVTGLINVGDVLSGTGVPNGTTIVSQLSGTPGGAGVYVTNQPTTSSGVTLLAFPQIAPFTGDLVTKAGSTITVAGFGANAISIQSELNGNLLQGGTITAQGNTSSGILANSAIDGSFVNTGTIQTTMPTDVNAAISTTILSPGWAAAFGGNIGGGILNAGPLNSADKTTTAVLSTLGATQALIIAPNVGSDAGNITVGLVADQTNPGFSIINRGSITSTGEQPGVSPIAVQIGNGVGDTSGLTTTLTGGIYNSGTIAAVATSDSQIPLALAPASANATAIMLGVGAKVPVLTNAATGSISATTTGPKGGVATALTIQNTGTTSTSGTVTAGSLQSLNNAGSITANAVSTDTTITTGLSAMAIQDLGGSLSSIVNSGTISATATQLNNNSQTTIAADLSANTTAVTFTNSGTVLGNVLFPNVANNVLTIDGPGANLSGQVHATGLGSVNISISPSGAGGIVHTTGIVNAGNLNVGPQGTLDIGISTATQVVSATGAVSFDAASHITVTPVALLPTNTTIRLVHSDASLTFGNYAATVSTVQIPFLFNGSLSVDNNNLTLNLQRKTEAQLGLTGNAATIFQPATTAALRDAALGAAIGIIGSNAELQAAMTQLLPVSSAADQAIAQELTDPTTNSVGVRQRSLLLDTLPEAGFNPWFQGSYSLLSGWGNDPYHSRGAGGTAGIDFSDPATGHFGIALTVQQSNIADKGERTAAESGSWYLVSPYMGLRSGNVFVDAQINAGAASLQNSRTVTIGSLTRIATSAPTITVASGALTGGYIFDLGFIRLMPQATLTGLALFNHNYTEQNGGAGVDLTVASHTEDAFDGFVGLGASASYGLFGGRLVPQLLAGWGHTITRSTTAGTASFATIPFSTFAIAAPSLASSHASGEIGLDFVAGNVSIGATYSAISTSSSLVQSARLTFSTRF